MPSGPAALGASPQAESLARSRPRSAADPAPAVGRKDARIARPAGPVPYVPAANATRARPPVTESHRCQCLRDPLRCEAIAQMTMPPPPSSKRHRPAPAIGRADARAAKPAGPVAYVPEAPATRDRQPVMESHRYVDASETRGKRHATLGGRRLDAITRCPRASLRTRSAQAHVSRGPPFASRGAARAPRHSARERGTRW